jgi:predicted alpha/beta superfamily hydrolase/sugar lactone lactonase YvrE
MKKAIILLIVMIPLKSHAQLNLIWENDSLANGPESIVYDDIRKCCYVSNFGRFPSDGMTYSEDYISSFSLEGKLLQRKMVSNITAPTGLCLHNDKLFIVERFGVVVFDLKQNKIEARYRIRTNNFLNDIAVDSKENIYVTASDTNILYRIKDARVEEWLRSDQISRANGITADGDKLIIGICGDSFLKSISIADKKISTLASLGEGIIDGIKKYGDDYFVSHYGGRLYLVKTNGEFTEILNTTGEKISCADFEFIESQGLFVIPALQNNKVFLYKYGPGKSGSAQNLAEIKDSIYSNVLKEQRAIRIFMPDTYKPGSDEKYEAIYLTDGEWASGLFPFIYKFAKGENYVPPVVIIALPNTYIDNANQRDRDFLPVHIADNAISGGADKFISFLKDELIPYISKNYPVNGSNSLYGHSYGGLFVMYALLKEPQLFQSYFATDPSFRWNNDFVIKMASERLGDLPAGKLLWIAGIESTYKNMGINRMDSVLKLKAPESLSWKIGLFPNETHNSVRLKAMYDGLKFSYSGYPGTPPGFHPMTGILLKDKPASIYLINNYPGLRYTTDGTEPDKTSPKADQKFSITGPAKLVLKSFSASGKYDAVARGSFELGEILPSAPKPKKVVPGGLKYSYYEGIWEKLPDFKKIKPVETGIADTLFNIKKLPGKTNFACLFEGYIEIATDGYYVFALGSDDGSKLYLGTKMIIDNDGLQSEESYKSFILPLEKGFYPIRLEYFQKDKNYGLQFIYLVPGTDNAKSVPLKFLYHN